MSKIDWRKEDWETPEAYGYETLVRLANMPRFETASYEDICKAGEILVDRGILDTAENTLFYFRYWWKYIPEMEALIEQYDAIQRGETKEQEEE